LLYANKFLRNPFLYENLYDCIPKILLNLKDVIFSYFTCDRKEIISLL